MRRALVLLTLAMSAAFVSSALAASPTCVAPPGAGAVDQYCEVVPGAGGPSTPARGGKLRPVPAPAPNGISPGTTRRLAEQGGQLGVAAAQALGATPPRVRPRHKAARDPRSVPKSSGNLLRALGNDIGGGPTVGSGLIWALLLIAIALSAAAWVRYRRRSPGARES